MRLLFLIFLWILPWLVLANTEKIIFISHSHELPQTELTVLNGLQILKLDKYHTSVRHQLPVESATKKSLLRKQSWLLVEGLEEGRRYEIRVCWAAVVNTLAYLKTV